MNTREKIANEAGLTIFRVSSNIVLNALAEQRLKYLIFYQNA